MKLVILSPSKEIYNNEIVSVNVPGTNGRFQILDNHAPIVSSLVEGEVQVIGADGGNETFQISGGFLEVIANEVSILVSGTQ